MHLIDLNPNFLQLKLVIMKHIFLYLLLLLSTAMIAQISGNVGIGTTTPSEKLEVDGNVLATQNLISIGRKVYFGNVARLLGNNTSALTFVSNDPSISQFILQDRDGFPHGRLYGENNGAQFGLLDSDINWSLLIAKDSYTSFLINNSEKMRITVGGSVGIGTSSPQDRLHIVGGDLRLSNQQEILFDGIGQIRSDNDNHRLLFRTSENIMELREEGAILFSPGATQGQQTDAMIVNALGNVGIGTITPQHKFDIQLGITRLKTYDFGLETTVNTPAGWARSFRFRNEDDQSLASFGAHDGYAFIATGFDINLDQIGHFNKKLVVAPNGNTGIGTSNPLSKLHIGGGDLRLDNSQEIYFEDNGQIRSRNNNHRLLFRTNQNIMEFREQGDILFSTGSTQGQQTNSMIINAAGDIGIGTILPEAKLDVNGAVKANWTWIGGGFNGGYQDGVSGLHNLHLDAARFNNTGGQILFLSQGVQRMILDQVGNLGVGQPNPEEKLHIGGSIRGNEPGGALRVNTQIGYIDIGPRNAGWAHIYTDMPNFIFNKDVYTFGGFSSYNNSDLALKTGGTTRILVNSTNGNVGVGTNSPNAKLEVAGKVKANWAWLGGDGGTTGPMDGVAGLYNLHLTASATNNIGGNIVFLSGGTQQMVMYPDGKLGIRRTPFYELDIDGYGRAIDFYTGSDQRYKENVRPIKQALQSIHALNAKQYTFKPEKIGGFDFTKEGGRMHYGFMAQDVQSVFPHLVRADDDGYLSVNYIGLIPVLVEALKEQEQTAEDQAAIIAKQEQEIDGLKARMDRLEALLLKE